MARLLLFLALVALTLGGCVPAGRLVYFQKKDELKNRKNIPKDTVLRSHKLDIQEYKIQPLDLLSIQFETLSDENDIFDFLQKISPRGRAAGGGGGSSLTGMLVDREGYVEYPVLGNIKVAGLTLFQAQDSIKAVAGQYIQDVAVRVRTLNFRYTVLGEVNGERTVISNNTRLTMAEAIGLAGGFGELADRRNVKIMRQVQDKVDIYYVDLLKEDFIESDHYYVQQGDVIIVPPLKQRTFRRYFIGNIGIITSTISFAVLIVTLIDRY